MAHSFLALLAGLAATVAVQAALAVLVRRAVPGWPGAAQAGSAFVGPFVYLGSAFLAGAAGGFVTAWAAQVELLAHVLVLAIGVLLLAATSAVQQRGRMPAAVLIGMVALTPLGAFAGGLVRLRMWGYF
jgi:hypothetical protein